MCSICVSTMSSRCLLYRAPNPNSQSIFNFGSYLMLFVCCYTLLYAIVYCCVTSFLNFLFILVSLSSQFFLPFTGWSLPQDFLGLPSNLYTFIIFRTFNFVNTFLNFFYFFCLALLSILLLYSDTFKLSILF